MLTGMEVANASMYDGSTAAAEAVLMAHRVTRRNKAVLCGRPASALPRDHRDGLAHGGRRDRGAACRTAPRRTSAAQIDCQRLVRRRAEPRRLRPAARPDADRRRAAQAAGALLVVVVTEVGLARPRRAAGRHGRRHRRRRGPVDRQRAHLRRPLCRPVRHAPEVRAADAGPAVRRDRRRGGPARLRADALDPRAAHPPREGDLQHLHQLRPLRAGLHHPHDPARRGGAAAARPHQPRQRRGARGHAWRRCRA